MDVTKDLKWIDTIHKAGRVERFHNQEMIKPQNDGEHSYSCALIAYHLANKIRRITDLEINPATCCIYLLLHDIPEVHTGDMPGPFKKDNPKLNNELKRVEEKWLEANFPVEYNLPLERDLNLVESLICRFVDTYECMLTVIREINMGNELLREKIAKFKQYFGVFYHEASGIDHDLAMYLFSIYSDTIDDFLK